MDSLKAFETPIFVFDVPGVDALNAELGRYFLAERLEAPGVQVSNVGGWHSVPDLALRQQPVFRELCAMLAAHFRMATERVLLERGYASAPPYGFGMTGWAMVMNPGDYTIVHDHAQATWSSAYYVDAGDADMEVDPTSGVFVCVDPRRSSPATPGADLFPSSYELRPATGKLFVFPGYLQHYVHAYRGIRPRISIAANASVKFQAGGPATSAP
jgi:uncharacterized protein (TIGR02466 family)